MTFGSNNDPASLLVETNCIYSAINLNTCKDCKSKPYDYASSKTMNNLGPITNYKVNLKCNE